MPESIIGPVSYREVLDEAYRIAKTHTALSFRPMQSVIIQHDDGMFVQHSAFYEVHDVWLYVFSEHENPRVFHLLDVAWYCQFQRIPGKAD